MQKYGIIAGINNPQQVKAAMNEFLYHNQRNEDKIEVVIVNGDMSSNVKSAQIPNHLNKIYKYLGDAGFLTLIQPGISDIPYYFESALQEAEKQYTNIEDARKHFNFFGADHQLLFVPGYEHPDYSSYTFGNTLPTTGSYEKRKQGWNMRNPFDPIREDEKICLNIKLEDIIPEIENPKETILVCPQAKRTHNLKGVDTVYVQRESPRKISIPTHMQSKSSIQALKKYSNGGVVYQKGTVGSDQLESFLKQQHITKSISSNLSIHSTEGFYSNEKFVQPHTFTNNMHWNSGRLEFGEMGIISVNKNTMSYEPLFLQLVFPLIPNILFGNSTRAN